jgi:hypothetical protein
LVHPLARFEAEEVAVKKLELERTAVCFAFAWLAVPSVFGQSYTSMISSERLRVICAKPQIDFKVATLGGAMLGLVGQAAIDKPKGRVLAEQLGLTDPSLLMRDAFLAALSLDQAHTEVLAGIRPDDNISRIQQELGKDGLVLEFRTIIWNLLPHGGDHKRIEYWGRARLIRLNSGEVVWKETAKFIGHEPEGQRPTAEEMLADNGAVLKLKIKEAADSCAEELVRRFTRGK